MSESPEPRFEPRGSVTPDGRTAVVDVTRIVRGSHSRTSGPVVVEFYGHEMRDTRYTGKCKGCKRPVSIVLPGRVETRMGTRPKFGGGVEQYVAARWTSVMVYTEKGLEDWARSVECPDCGKRVGVSAVKGAFKAEVRCDARCTGARGSNCECSCAGANHGADWGI